MESFIKQQFSAFAFEKIYNIFILYCAFICTNLYSLGEVVKNGCYATNLTPIFQNKKLSFHVEFKLLILILKPMYFRY